MKVQITYRVFYKNHNKTKIVNVKNCRDKTNAENKFKKWSAVNYKNAKSIEILDTKEIEVDKTVEYLKTMFNMN